MSTPPSLTPEQERARVIHAYSYYRMMESKEKGSKSGEKGPQTDGGKYTLPNGQQDAQQDDDEEDGEDDDDDDDEDSSDFLDYSSFTDALSEFDDSDDLYDNDLYSDDLHSDDSSEAEQESMVPQEGSPEATHKPMAPEEDDPGTPWPNLLNINIKTPLLFNPSLITRTSKSCSNAILRSGLWGKEPETQLHGYDMGLLSRLAHLCSEARIRPCTRSKCLALREKMKANAPKCDWAHFREWAITAMSCQAAMSMEERVTLVHAHIASAANACSGLVKKCARCKAQLRSYLDADAESKIGLPGVFNIIFWMARIQGVSGIGPQQFGHWNHHLIPKTVALPPVEEALSIMNDMKICKHRIWKLIDVSERKEDDLPEIAAALRDAKQNTRPQRKRDARQDRFPQRKPIEEHNTLSQLKHGLCVPNKCQQAHMNTDDVKQLHKCELAHMDANAVKQLGNRKPPIGCTQKKFPIEHLLTALEQGKSTAWQCDGARLVRPGAKYMAISHVWGDGTGAGKAPPGTVNSCLFDYFANIARNGLGCDGIWWDVISIPKDPEARSKALNQMHYNYKNAECTLIHDSYLVQLRWSDDGIPCLALVLSSWFTRAWTALELSMSKKVKVVFAASTGNGYVLKDLDKDVLAQNPKSVSRAWWLATTLIEQLRAPIQNVGDLLSILSPRSTSYIRDRTKVAALLAQVPDCDYTKEESAITMDIIKFLGKVPYTCLFHGKSTIKDLGGFSWCPATLDEMPIDTSKDLQDSSKTQYLDVDPQGVAEGPWWYRPLVQEDDKDEKIKPYGDELFSQVKIRVALRHWESCLLLRANGENFDTQALLVVPIRVLNLRRGRVLKCRYIGAVAVVEKRDAKAVDIDAENSPWKSGLIQMGGSDSGKDWMPGNEVLEQMNKPPNNDKYDSDSDTDSDSDDKQKEPLPLPKPEKKVRIEWIRNRDIKDTSSLPSEGPLGAEKPLTQESLCRAIREGNKDAATWLVRGQVKLDPGRLSDLIKELSKGGSKVNLITITKFGQVLAESGFYPEAIDVYEQAKREYETVGDNRIAEPVDRWRIEYSLALAYQKSNDKRKAEKAKEALKEVLEQCKRNREKPKVQNELPMALGNSDKKRLARKKAKGGKELVSRDFKEAKKNKKRDNAWYRLELNAIGELMLLNIGDFEFDDALEAYSRASEGIGEQKDNEVLKMPWVGRETKDFKAKRERDEYAAGLYVQMLRTFNETFHGQHSLISITALHLGVNYMLQDRFQDAQKHLSDAVDGFEKQFPDGGHPVIGLSQYHLGTVYMRMDDHDSAKKAFKEAMRHLAGFKHTWLYCAVHCAHAKSTTSPTQLKLGELNGEINKTMEVYTVGDCREPIVDFLIHSANTVAEAAVRRKEWGNRAMDLCKTAHGRIGDGNTHKNPIHASEMKLVWAKVLQNTDPKKAESKALEAFHAFGEQNGPESLSCAHAAETLSSIEDKLGDKDKAKDMARKAIQIYTKALGAHHPRTLKACQDLGCLHLSYSELKDAEANCLRAYEGFSDMVGPESQPTIEAARTLGRTYYEAGKFLKAKDMFQKVSAYFAHRPDTSTAIHKAQAFMDLGQVLAQVNGPGDMRHPTYLLDRALEILELNVASNPREYLEAHLRAGRINMEAGRLEKAQTHLQESLNGFRNPGGRLPREPLRTKTAEAELALGQLKLRRMGDEKSPSKDLIKEVDALVSNATRELGKLVDYAHPLMLEACSLTSELLLSVEDKRDKAERSLEAVLKDCKRFLSSGHPMTLRIINRLLEHHNSRKNIEKVKLLLDEKLEFLKDAHGLDEAIMIMHLTEPAHTPNYHNRTPVKGHYHGYYEESWGPGEDEGFLADVESNHHNGHTRVPHGIQPSRRARPDGGSHPNPQTRPPVTHHHPSTSGHPLQHGSSRAPVDSAVNGHNDTGSGRQSRSGWKLWNKKRDRGEI